MKRASLLILMILFLFSCKNKNDDNISSISQITSNYDSLTTKVKKSGDINAYDELYYGFKDSNEKESIDSIMFYSRIMSQKFNYKIAYLHYFDAICEKEGINPYDDYDKINLNKLDSSSKNEAILCLKKMLEYKIITKEDFNKAMRNKPDDADISTQR